VPACDKVTVLPVPDCVTLAVLFAPACTCEPGWAESPATPLKVLLSPDCVTLSVSFAPSCTSELLIVGAVLEDVPEAPAMLPLPPWSMVTEPLVPF